jgi:hypothetical protein
LGAGPPAIGTTFLEPGESECLEVISARHPCSGDVDPLPPETDICDDCGTCPCPCCYVLQKCFTSDFYQFSCSQGLTVTQLNSQPGDILDINGDCYTVISKDQPCVTSWPEITPTAIRWCSSDECVDCPCEPADLSPCERSCDGTEPPDSMTIILPGPHVENPFALEVACDCETIGTVFTLTRKESNFQGFCPYSMPCRQVDHCSYPVYANLYMFVEVSANFETYTDWPSGADRYSFSVTVATREVHGDEFDCVPRVGFLGASDSTRWFVGDREICRGTHLLYQAGGAAGGTGCIPHSPSGDPLTLIF